MRDQGERFLLLSQICAMILTYTIILLKFGANEDHAAIAAFFNQESGNGTELSAVDLN